MKTAVIFYHKEIDRIYQPEWIQQCIDSIKAQTHTEFDVFELNYGGQDKRYCEGMKGHYIFLNKKFQNHIGAMNYLYDLCFQYGYDVVFNTNMDDYYHPERFEKQLEVFKNGYHIVSTGWQYVRDGIPGKVFDYSDKDPNIEFSRGHNIIAHPSVAIHSSFWGDELRYKDLLGKEDLDLWQRAVTAGKHFGILTDTLLYYRLHENQVTKTYKQ